MIDARKGEKERREVKGNCGRICEKVGNANYGGIVQPSQQHVGTFVKVVEWGLGTRGLR